MATTAQAIEIDAVQAWFAQQVDEVQGPLQFDLIAGGHSNLTFRVVDAAGRKYALRRPPVGFKPQMGAHDVIREQRILSALAGSEVPVPKVVGVCSDDLVTGAPFYVMRWVEGRILDRENMVASILESDPARRQTAFNLVDALASLHRCSPDALGLGDLGARENYLGRQLNRWTQVWQRVKTRELPIIEAVQKLLVSNQPPQVYTGIVHGDFRLGNMMLAQDGTVAAVLDWELCALGDVLLDLGYLLANWDLPEDPWPDVWMQRAPTRAGGFPTRAELIEHYAEQTGFEVRNIDYYVAFCYWRIAVIAEDVKRRYESGKMFGQTADLTLLDQRVRQRAEMAQYYLERASSR